MRGESSSSSNKHVITSDAPAFIAVAVTRTPSFQFQKAATIAVRRLSRLVLISTAATVSEEAASTVAREKEEKGLRREKEEKELRCE